MSTVKTLTVPVIGMTCANCVAAVERNAKKVTTVTDAAVNFASERLTVNYDPAISKPQEVLTDVIARVERAGYSVPTESVELPLLEMTCANCANTIQRRLNKVEGVISAEVNYATERAAVQFVPGATSYSELVAAVRQAGYDVVESASTGETQDAEAAAREAEVRHQWTRLIVGVIFALPLFLLSMARDFNLVGAWRMNPGSTGSFWCWPHRCNFMSAGITMWVPTKACAMAAPTWMCWWRWGRLWPTSIASLC